MNKVFCGLVLTVFFSCTSVPEADPNSLSFDEALAVGIQKIEIDLPEESDIAVLDFKSDNPNLSSYIIEEMYDKLINGGRLSIMERSRIDTIKSEVGYQLSGEVDDNEIINIGHQLGADYVVTGQITFSGEAYRLRVFAIDIEQGRRVASSSLNIRSNDRQINYLLSSKTTENTQVVNTNNDAKNEDVLYEAVHGLLNRIPKNSRVLVTGITGSNELTAQDIQAAITNEAKDISITTKEQRTAAIEMQDEYFSGDYSYDSLEYASMDGANIILTGGVFGTGYSRRIVFRSLDVNTGVIISESCVLFTQNNTELINNVEDLSQRINSNLSKGIRSDASILVNNKVGTSRNGDFVFDMIENNLVNLFKYKVVTRSEIELLQEELNYQYTSGRISDDTAGTFGSFLGAQYLLNIEYTDGKIHATILDVSKGNLLMQETM